MKHTVLLVPSQEIGWKQLLDTLSGMADVQIVGNVPCTRAATDEIQKYTPDVIFILSDE